MSAHTSPALANMVFAGRTIKGVKRRNMETKLQVELFFTDGSAYMVGAAADEKIVAILINIAKRAMKIEKVLIVDSDEQFKMVFLSEDAEELRIAATNSSKTELWPLVFWQTQAPETTS